MKVKEYIDETTERIEKFLKDYDVESQTRKDNESILNILYKERNKNIEEIKKDLEELENKYEILSYREGYEDRCDELIQQIGALKDVLRMCGE